MIFDDMIFIYLFNSQMMIIAAVIGIVILALIIGKFPPLSPHSSTSL